MNIEFINDDSPGVLKLKDIFVRIKRSGAFWIGIGCNACMSGWFCMVQDQRKNKKPLHLVKVFNARTPFECWLEIIRQCSLVKALIRFLTPEEICLATGWVPPHRNIIEYENDYIPRSCRVA